MLIDSRAQSQPEARRPFDTLRRLAPVGSIPEPFACALPAIVLAVCLLVPFLGKAYTVDDTLFLRQAEHALIDPLHPAAFDYQWSENRRPVRVSQVMPSGPVMSYLLVPAVLLENGEWAGHAIELIFLAAAAIALASIALRLGYGREAAVLAALFLVASPAVLGMTATCMPDTVAMAFGALGIERTLAWRDNRRVAAGIGAALALALAIATRSHCAMLLLPALVFAVCAGLRARTIEVAPGMCGESARARGDRWRAMAAGALPVLAAPLLAWICFRITRDAAAGGDVASSVFRFARTAWKDNFYAFLFHHTLAFPFGIGMFFAGMLAGRPDAMLLVALPLAFGFGFRRANGDYLLILASGLALAGFLRAGIVEWARSRATAIALAAWVLAPLPVVFYIHLPSKYLLASAPAISILLASALSRRPAVARRVLASVLLVLAATVGVLVVRADSQMAGLGREAARTIVAPAVRSGVRVWFAGHWGFQWYVEHAGARPLLRATQPRAGDLIVVSRNMRADEVPGCAEGDCRLVTVLSETKSGGRVMAGGAGFYSNVWGAYPWVWSSSPDERIEVWKVSAASAVNAASAPSTHAPVRLAIAGFVHANARAFLDRLESRHDVQLVGLAEPDAAARNSAVLDYGLPRSLVFSDLDRMLAEVRPDAVAVFTATSLHPQVIEACTRRRVRAVMVEKPLAISVADGERVRRAAEVGRTAVLVDYDTTWYPSLLAVRTIVKDAPRVGAIRKMIATDGHRGPKEMGLRPEVLGWLLDPSSAGAGALYDFGCYGANLITWLMDDQRPLAVTAVLQHFKPVHYPGVDDEATVIVEYEGAQGVIQASWNAPVDRKDLEVYTERGSAIAAGPHNVRVQMAGRQQETRTPAVPPPDRQDALSYLAALVRGRLTPSGRSALRNNLIVTEILAAARESARTGRRVTLREAANGG